MRCLLFATALSLASGGRSLAQRTPPVTKFGVMPSAAHALDSLARTSWKLKVETAGCITQYAVLHDTLLVAEIAPAKYERADAMTIVADGLICPVGVPSVHTHLATISNPDPSPIDSATSRKAGVWSLVLVVTDSTWRLILYGGAPPQ